MATDQESNQLHKISPVLRFWRYIQSERKDIWYIYVYAIVVGLIGLSLPLGIQAVIQMISGGMLFDTAILIIILVLLGVAITGVLQVMQIYLVEVLQRRLFAKATYEFAYRLPRIKADAIAGDYPPEVANRFFDVLLLQKGISKILIDLTVAILQIIFGLILLAFYHPTFILFDILFILAAFLVFRVTGKKGLDTSIKESSYKYKMIAWLQEIARNLTPFKMNGADSNLALEKTDIYTLKYIESRKNHFKVLLVQYINILTFKLLIIAATLILGSLLVVDRQINLGQFVATEIIIVLILGAIEKLIVSVDTVYDAFTSVEKISKITDYPLETSGHVLPEDYNTNNGFSISTQDISYTAYNGKQVLNNINLEINAGQTVAIVGRADYGIDALINILSGIYQSYSGIVQINGISITDMHLNHLRSQIAISPSTIDLFEGTVLENITVGNPVVNPIDVINTLKTLGVYEEILLLPDGLDTKIMPGGIGVSKELCAQINIARNVLRKPRLWIVHGHNYSAVMHALQAFGTTLQKPTIIAVGNNVLAHKTSDIIYLIADGNIVAKGPYTELQTNPIYKKLIQL